MLPVPAGAASLFLPLQAASTSKVVAVREQRDRRARNFIISDVLSRLEYRAPKVSYTQLRARLLATRLLRLRYKRKFVLLAILIILVFIIQFVFPHNLKLASFYNNYIFRPFQSLRNLIFGAIPFSVGDALYLLGFFVLIATIIRWVYYLIRIRLYHHDLSHSVLSSIITLGTIYLLFFVGWGGNYYRPTLSKFWQLTPSAFPVKETIVTYDSFLITRLNALAPDYHGLSFPDVNRRAKTYYKTLTGSRTRLRGMRSKASLYGYFMQYLGIQGYYNPFTGEAQVNGALPQFMLPFVVCHEMAHQSGIAAEDDANLLSYAICTIAPDSAFAYSGYFNLWLYTQSRLKQMDSVLAKSMLESLNPVSHAQLDTLRAIRRKYRNGLSEYSGALYDSYLRMHNQKDGIKSYNNVALSAWAWELQRAGKRGVVEIP